MDNAFIIDLNIEDQELVLIGYKDLTSWSITKEEKVDKIYGEYKNEILPIIKNRFKQ